VSKTVDPPRIWWCPTGPLSFLPIHAARDYSKGAIGFKVSDFVTSSYTPTSTALIERSRISPKTFQGLLAVSQPNTPGKSWLPNAAKEISDIQRLGSTNFPVHSLPGELATTDVKGMGERSWVHLACHAVQDVSEPSQSAFCLHDGRLTLSRVISNSFRHADFAFLSACQTAKGDDNLSEEAVHLAGGMVVAGYRSVIATMWSIKDNDAPLVANEVYRHFNCDSSPDSSRAAHALHHAVKKNRDKLGTERGPESTFSSWVPFIHVGI
jgi:CHAT domain-containing protein